MLPRGFQQRRGSAFSRVTIPELRQLLPPKRRFDGATDGGDNGFGGLRYEPVRSDVDGDRSLCRCAQGKTRNVEPSRLLLHAAESVNTTAA